MVAKLIKADLQCFCLYLYQKPVQMEGCFTNWMLCRKYDKSHSFNVNVNVNVKQVKEKSPEVLFPGKL